MPEAPRVRTEVDGDVSQVVLARPEAGNVIDVPMADALAAALRDRPPALRAVLLRAEGSRFCVGGDVRAFAGSEDPGAFVGRLAGRWHEVLRTLLACPVPVVAAVQGAVAGAAVGPRGACDVVVCARSAVVRPAYSAIGFSPDGGTSCSRPSSAAAVALGRRRSVTRPWCQPSSAGQRATATGVCRDRGR